MVRTKADVIADTQRRLDLARAQLETWTAWTPASQQGQAKARRIINQLRLDVQAYERALAAYRGETPNAQNLSR